jgi:hypothetical protein
LVLNLVLDDYTFVQTLTKKESARVGDEFIDEGKSVVEEDSDSEAVDDNDCLDEVEWLTGQTPVDEEESEESEPEDPMDLDYEKKPTKRSKRKLKPKPKAV